MIEAGPRRDDEEAMTNEIARMLKPGGKALIFDYDNNLESIMGWLSDAGLEIRFVMRDLAMDVKTGAYINAPGEFSQIQRELDCVEGNLIIIAEKPTAWTRANASKIHAPSYLAPS